MVVHVFMHRETIEEEVVHQVNVFDIVNDLVLQNAGRVYQSIQDVCEYTNLISKLRSTLPFKIQIDGMA